MSLFILHIKNTMSSNSIILSQRKYKKQFKVIRKLKGKRIYKNVVSKSKIYSVLQNCLKVQLISCFKTIYICNFLPET